MDSCCCLFYSTTRVSFPVLPSHRPPISFRRRPSIVACEYGGLLEPKTPAGKLLTGVVLDGRDDFHVVATKELQRIAAQRDEAVARLLHISAGSDEAVLHRRIAELKKKECQDEVEDLMYVFILRKFSEMRVHLTPSLTKCVYNHRLEIWPSKDWELESIHNFEVLEMVREHLTATIGLKPNANIRDHWAAARIGRLQLCKLYTASILYGYFLKSASLRHQLEWSLGQNQTNSGLSSRSSKVLPISEVTSIGSEYIGFGRINSSTSTSQASLTYNRKWENLRHYVMGFDPEMIQMCANPKSIEALNLIERHSCALFGDEKTGLILKTDDELIYTSFATLKRFILEAVAFGSFLWDMEDQVSDVYTLEDNKCCG